MSKPAKTHQEQLDLWKSRGLVVPDEPLALHILAHHNYYRLSAYRFPYTLPGQPDVFRPGATFDQLWNLYHFDRSLRQLLLEACKRVEISARTQWAYVTSHRLGPLGYLENAHFSDPLTHARTLVKLDSEMNRSNEEFVKHHKQKLGMPWPPAWVIAEVASFGNVSHLIGQLREPSLRQAIADAYQLDEKTFCSLLHHLSVVRNTAAHHSRIWNRKFTIALQLPRKKPPHLHANFHQPPGTEPARCLYNTLVLILHLVHCIEPASHLPIRLIRILRDVNAARLPDMGFPPDWETRPIWDALLTATPGKDAHP
jgi:abortive infection bacteriophage resistance protein